MRIDHSTKSDANEKRSSAAEAAEVGLYRCDRRLRRPFRPICVHDIAERTESNGVALLLCSRCFLSILVIHPGSVGRHDTPSVYTLLRTPSPIHKPVVRPLHPLTNAKLNNRNKRKRYFILVGSI